VPLFRSRIEPAAAFEKIFLVVTNFETPGDVAGIPSARIAEEQTYVTLFAALIALKFCHKADWRNNGQDLLAAISARLFNEKTGFGGLEQTTLSDRMQYYNLAIEIDPSAEGVSAEIGKSFAMLFSQDENACLAAIGSRTFVSTFERIVNITSLYKL
jgi:hypothetical protein